MRILPYSEGPVSDNRAINHRLVSFAPGRVNLIGEHTDYNGGMVMPAAISLGIRAELMLCAEGGAGHAQGGEIRIASRTSGETVCFRGEEISEIVSSVLSTGIDVSSRVAVPGLQECQWGRYVVGCFAMFEAALRLRGESGMPWSGNTLEISLDSTLPQGSGLSSSAALCVSILGQLNNVAGDPLDVASIARLAMYVEHRFVGTVCGMMDQLAVLCSRANHFTCIDFLRFPTSREFDIQYVSAHQKFRDHQLLIFKTGVSHSLAESAYNERRSSCERALVSLNRALGIEARSLGEIARSPRFRGLEEGATLRMIESLLGDSEEEAILARRACHAMCENGRVIAAVQALSSGHAQTLGAVMRASHDSLDNLYEVSCDELNHACRAVGEVAVQVARGIDLNLEEALIGPRMTGGGFGGSTIQLVARSIGERLVDCFSSPTNPYTVATGIIPELFLCDVSSGFSIG
jgi:galactokinase